MTGALGRSLVRRACERPQGHHLRGRAAGKCRDDDPLWNAAQKQMVLTGWMHNYLRMYWAKKILKWSPSVALAVQRAVWLNDRYELDGRDPNGYAGIAWRSWVSTIGPGSTVRCLAKFDTCLWPAQERSSTRRNTLHKLPGWKVPLPRPSGFLAAGHITAAQADAGPAESLPATRPWQLDSSKNPGRAGTINRVFSGPGMRFCDRDSAATANSRCSSE